MIIYWLSDYKRTFRYFIPILSIANVFYKKYFNMVYKNFFFAYFALLWCHNPRWLWIARSFNSIEMFMKKNGSTTRNGILKINGTIERCVFNKWKYWVFSILNAHTRFVNVQSNGSRISESEIFSVTSSDYARSFTVWRASCTYSSDFIRLNIPTGVRERFVS